MKKSTFKTYIGTYLTAFAFVLILTIISHTKGTYFLSASITFSKAPWSNTFQFFLYKGKTFVVGNYLFDLLSVVVIPFIFIGVFLLIDLLSSALKGKKKREQEKDEANYEKFADDIASELGKTKIFNYEDFRHFRENDKFQVCLNKLYQIYKNGETEQSNYYLVLRKFDKGTQERKAIEYLVTYTEKRRKEKEETNEQL